MTKPIVALDFLARTAKHAPRPICVLFGDEPFLKRHALTRLRGEVLAGHDAEFSSTSFAGPTATLSAVMDELSTLAMFGGGERLVVIDQADDFVSRYRTELERYAEHPKTSSVLVLDVASWPSNTRLYKALAESGLVIECKFPAAARLQKWLIAWTKEQYHARLDADAAEILIDVIEPELGLFDSELSKLALLAGAEGVIGAELVREVVGGWRTRTTWEMLDLAAGGNARQALVELDHLLSAGEVPISILAQIGSTLRRFAAAARLIEQADAAGRRLSLRQALEQAGFKAFTLSKAEGQLRQIGRVRAGQLYRWLLDADLALKGASSSPSRGRLVLERLLIRLSTAATAGPPAHATAS
ncbi:MAG TPA: DNA polymerase III subunit delta [Pirellulales bacterium]|jgi:DNA polymerase-3 subunit delta|nr:DNA polymerase III subunit delta [Pirellulales bacterium]